MSDYLLKLLAAAILVGIFAPLIVMLFDMRKAQKSYKDADEQLKQAYREEIERLKEQLALAEAAVRRLNK